MNQPWSCSVAQSCPAVYDPMNRSTPGLPVLHHLPEFAQTHVHRVSDAIQPSHPLSSPSLPTISSVQSLSCVRLFVTPWITEHQASLSITNSRSLLKLMPIELVMPCSHAILCHPLLLLPPIPPSIRVFSNESTLCMRWPKNWSFSFSISPSNEHTGLISFRMDWLDLLAVRGTLKSLLQHHSSKASVLCIRWPKEWTFRFNISVSNEHPGLISFMMDLLDLLAIQGTLKSLLQHHISKASILWSSAFFTVQLSHPYKTTGKAIALTRWTFVGKVMALLFNMLSRLVITFLPRDKRLLISWLQSPLQWFWSPKKIVSHCFPTYLPWSDRIGYCDLSFLIVDL